MMCEHEYCERLREKQEIIMNLDRELAAANARVVELERQQFAGQTWVSFDEHMKALRKIKQMEDAIKFDFERFMEFQQRAETAEAQVAAMREALEEIRCCVTTCNTPIETVHAMDNIAAAALDPK